MKTYFGFAISDSMFNGNLNITRTNISVDAVKALLPAAIPCLNPSHVATIDAMKQRFDLEVEIPSTPPRVNLDPLDRLIVMSVRGLPRLTDRHEYTPEEIQSATFSFSLWTVLPTVEDVVNEINRDDLPKEIAEHYATLKGPRTRGSTTEHGLEAATGNFQISYPDQAVTVPGATYLSLHAPELGGRLGAVPRHKADAAGATVQERLGSHGPELFTTDGPSINVACDDITVILGPDNWVWTWHPGEPLASLKHVGQDHPCVAVKLS